MKKKYLIPAVSTLLATYFIYKVYIKNKRKINFNGKVVLLTGASRGLGVELGRILAKEGAKLAICGRDNEKLQQAKSLFEKTGAEVFAVACDLTNKDDLENMLNDVLQNFGKVDVVINNAGTDIVASLEDTTKKDFEDLLNLHFWAPYQINSIIIPFMKDKKQGRIVNISSLGGKISMPHMVAYCTSKHALVGYSDGLSTELKKDNIFVTTVCPGFLRTGTQHNVSFKGQHKKEFAWFSYVISLPFTSMSAERAAKKILHACRFGEAELVMPIYAKLLTIYKTIAPQSFTNFSAFLNKLLPEPGGIGALRALGRESYSDTAPSFWTKLSDKAAERNNQFEN